MVLYLLWNAGPEKVLHLWCYFSKKKWQLMFIFFLDFSYISTILCIIFLQVTWLRVKKLCCLVYYAYIYIHAASCIALNESLIAMISYTDCYIMLCYWVCNTWPIFLGNFVTSIMINIYIVPYMCEFYSVNNPGYFQVVCSLSLSLFYTHFY